MLARSLAILLTLLAAPSWASAARAAQHTPSWVIIDVSILTMDDARIREHQNVFLHGDRIVAIAATDPARTWVRPMPIARGATAQREYVTPQTAVLVGRSPKIQPTVIDGRGHFLIPGLCDMHVHSYGPEVNALYVANGVTRVRHMAGDLELLRQRARVQSGELFGPALHIASPIIDGAGHGAHNTRILDDPAGAHALVSEFADAGFDAIKVYDGLSRPVYSALAREAHRAGLALIGHVPGAVGLDRVLASRQRTIEHLTGYARALERRNSPAAVLHGRDAEQLAWSFLDEVAVRRYAVRTRAAGVWNCPTLAESDAWIAPADFLAACLRPEMRYVSPTLLRRWSQGYWRTLAPESLAVTRAAMAGRMRVVRALHAVGAPLLAGSDTDSPFVVPGFSLHRELELMIEAGLSPYEALRTATANPADCLGLSREFGRVRVGLRADLLLLEGNPLTDPELLRRPLEVFMAGQRYSRANLQERMEHIAADYARELDAALWPR